MYMETPLIKEKLGEKSFLVNWLLIIIGCQQQHLQRLKYFCYTRVVSLAFKHTELKIHLNITYKTGI